MALFVSAEQMRGIHPGDLIGFQRHDQRKARQGVMLSYAAGPGILDLLVANMREAWASGEADDRISLAQVWQLAPAAQVVPDQTKGLFQHGECAQVCKRAGPRGRVIAAHDDLLAIELPSTEILIDRIDMFVPIYPETLQIEKLASLARYRRISLPALRKLARKSHIFFEHAGKRPASCANLRSVYRCRKPARFVATDQTNDTSVYSCANPHCLFDCLQRLLFHAESFT